MPLRTSLQKAFNRTAGDMKTIIRIGVKATTGMAIFSAVALAVMENNERWIRRNADKL